MSVRKLILFAALFASLIAISAVVLNYFQTPPISNLPENSNTQTNYAPNYTTKKPDEKKTESNPKLQSQTDALLYLFDRMPPAPVYLIDEPIIKTGTNTERGVAYTDCGKDKIPTIYVKKVFYEKANSKFLTNILKHELTHAWQCRRGAMAGHDAEFRRQFAKTGGFGN